MKKKPIIQSRTMRRMYALSKKRAIDLSLSENPLGCSPLVIRALKKIQVRFNNYPSPNGKELRDKLSQKLFISKNNLFVANGSESIINDLPRIFCNIGDEVLVPELTFPMFAVCSELAGAKVVLIKMTSVLGIDLLKIQKNISKHTTMVFLCNPNNPTGSILSRDKLIKFVRQVPKNILIVVDEANIEFGGESLVDEVIKQNNLIVLRTLSKGFGLASLRIGFAVASKEIIQKLKEETPIFQISEISEQLACVALDDDDFLQRTKQIIKEQRMFLEQELVKLGFVVFPSEANNLFVKLPSFLSAKQFTEKLNINGISVIMGSNFEGFYNSFFRVSVRDAAINKMFIKKIKEIVKELV